MEDCRNEGMNSWRAEKSYMRSPADSYIERRFECRCEELAEGNDILTEWRERKRQYISWTSTIAYDFQHFSRHDNSHSVNILEVIEMLLGKERIDKLSAGDLWLLLECAYQHDIGMAITYEELVTLWQNQDFKDYIEERIFSELTDERKAALFYSKLEALIEDQKAFDEAANGKQTKTTNFFDNEIPWEVNIQKCLMFLVSSYIRSGHADRASELNKRIPISENSVIPERLYVIASEASKLHGESNYEKIINQLKEVSKGFGNGCVHPRFVCAMLRVGDVLDIENNRFNIRALKHFGELPHQSMLHFMKHKAIRHIKITQMQVEVEASSVDMEVCKVLSDDFKWIKDEINNLICHWNVMMPKDLGGCTLQQSKCKIYIGNSKRCYDSTYEHRVEMDREKLMPLFMGGNIYKDKLEFIREYLQNALDATKMQLWLDVNKNKIHRKLNPQIYDKSELTPFDISCDLYEQYPIEVTYEVDLRKSCVKLGIRDYGIGIERDCKGMITNIGKGWKERTSYSRELKKMPEWLRPTGGFGIGMQSAFMVSNEIEIYTHSVKDTEGYKMIMESPEKGGRVITEDYDMEETGTVVYISVSLEEFMSWNRKWKNKTIGYNEEKVLKKNHPGEIKYELSDDFFNDQSFVSYIGKFLEIYIGEKVNHRLFPIYISTKNREDKILPINFHPRMNYWLYEKTSKADENDLYILNNDDGIAYIDKLRMVYYGWIRKEKLLYLVDLNNSNYREKSNNLNGITYKNVFVSDEEQVMPYRKHLKIYMDLFSGDVKQMLKVNRSEFREGETTEKWELAVIRHFFSAISIWREKENAKNVESLNFFNRLYQEEPFYYLYQTVYGNNEWEDIRTDTDSDEKSMISGEIYRLKENEWFRLNKIVPFKKIYRQVRDLLEGKEDARMVFIVDVIKKNDDFSAVRLNPTNENDLKNKNVKSNKFSPENVNLFCMEEQLFIEDNDLFNLIVRTQKVKIDYFIISGFGKNYTLYAWLTPKEKNKIEMNKVDFYKKSWNRAKNNSRYYCEISDSDFYKEIQVDEMPYDISEQTLDNKRRWIISPIHEENVRKLDCIRKISKKKFYDEITSDDTYEMLIGWVYEHQSEARKYSKEQIRDSYKKYMNKIYEYNLVDID